MSCEPSGQRNNPLQNGTMRLARRSGRPWNVARFRSFAVMQTHVEFRSDRFPPVAGEEDEVNPGRYSKRLAEFIRRGLAERGFDVAEPFAEDWGWCVPIRNDRFPLWVGCGNYEEYPDGFLCFIEPRKPVIRRWFRKIDTAERVSAVRAALDDLLQTDGIRDVKWWDDTSNNPRR